MEYNRTRIKVGVSACVFGAKVRWNMKGWDFIKYFERETEQFVWYPVCPECMAGLGVPRSPIRILGESGHAVLEGNAKVMSRENLDVTKKIIESCKFNIEMLKEAGVSAYIFMEGSPSCGVYRTTLKNKRLGKPPGVFGAMLLKEGFFLIPAVDLQSPIKRWDWRRRLQAFEWCKKVSVENKEQMYEFWHKIKFLCQEVNENQSRELGRELAQVKDYEELFFESIKNKILLILREPSTVDRIKNRLWKHYAYYKKKTGQYLPEICPPEIKRNMTELVKELIELEKASVKDEVLFGASPILFRR